MSRYWNENVKGIEPYVPGEQPKDKKYIKLNTNENPYPPSPKVIEAISKAVNGDLRLYPDPTCSDLINKIADYYNVDNHEVFIGNGSDEILAFIFMTYFEKGKKVLFPDISYTFYKVYAELFKLDYNMVKLDDEFNIPLDEFKKKNGGVILPNPNAPTGKYINVYELEDVVKANEDSVVVIDEAYVDFGGESMIPFTKKYKNLLVVQTLSKSRALAGLRVGFAIGNKELIEGLNRVKNSMNSYTIDRIALAGAKAAIEDDEYFRKITKSIIETRQKYIVKIKELGFRVLDSKANFIFVKHNQLEGKYLYQQLKEKGVLVRYFDKERIEDYLRITIGTNEEMEVLIEKIKEIINN